jgi:hypothetical protein
MGANGLIVQNYGGAGPMCQILPAYGAIIAGNLILEYDSFNGNPAVIGIGTSTPTHNLHVVGSGLITNGLSVSGLITANSGNFINNLQVNGTGVSISGHTHTASNITNFNSSVSGLLPVKDIVAGNNIAITSSSGTYTINATAAGGTGLQSSSYVSQGKLSGNQLVTSGGDAIIQFVDDYDPQSWFDTTTRRFQPNIAGYYLINVGAWMDDADTTNGQANVQIRLNNNTVLLVQNQLNDVTGLSLTGSKAVYLNGTTDYVDFTFYHSTGSSKNLLSGANGTWFTAIFLAWSAPPIGTQNYISKFGTSGSGIVNSLIFDNGTNVGIGTSSPSGKLDINGTLYVGTTGVANNFYIRTGQAGISETALRLRTDTSSNLYLDASNAYVKVGNQSADVDIYAGNGPVRIGNNSAQTLANQNIRFVPANTEVMRITPTGVGIGTTTPSGQLHVAGLLQGNSVGTTGIIVSNSHASQSANGQDHTSLYVNPTFLTTSSNLNNTYGLLISPSSSGTYNTTNSYGLRVNASTLISGTITNNYSAIFMGGNVGVGTANPTSQLHVVGTGSFTNIDINNSAIAGSAALTVNGNIITQNNIIRGGTFSIYGDNNTRVYKPDGSTLGYTVSSSGYKHSFGYENLGTHMAWMVVGSGGVGIGTITPSGQLHVVGDTYIDNSSKLYIAASGASKTRNYIWSTTNGNLEINAGGPSVLFSPDGGYVDLGRTVSQYINIGHGYLNAGANNQHLRFTPGGTELMRITNSGTMGIGLPITSSLFNQQPYANTRVHIAGSGANSSSAALIVTDSGISPLLYVRNDGNIGIGTTSPTSKLHVAGDVLATGSFIGGSGTAGNPSFEFTGDPDTGLFSPAANTIALATSGVERFRIANNGSISMSGSLNVDPQNAGQINCMYVNAGNAIGGSLSTDTLYINQAITSTNYGGTSIALSDTIQISSNDGANITLSDNIAMNCGGQISLTCDPAASIQLNGPVNTNNNLSVSFGSPLNGDEGIVFCSDSSIYINDSGPGPMFSLDQNNGLSIYGNGGATPSNGIILSTDRSNLRIGIGTSTPDSTLHVAGDVNIDGNLTFDSFTESVVAIGNSSTSKTISLTSGTVQTCTLTANCTFTMPTATAGKSFSLFLNTGSGGFTASFIGVRWSDSTPPTITSTASKVDLLSFISDGSFWYGSFSQNYG